jgi:hypothetical protein
VLKILANTTVQGLALLNSARVAEVDSTERNLVNESLPKALGGHTVTPRLVEKAILGKHRRGFWAIATALGPTLVEIVVGHRNSNSDALALSWLQRRRVDG